MVYNIKVVIPRKEKILFLKYSLNKKSAVRFYHDSLPCVKFQSLTSFYCRDMLITHK